MNRRHDHWAAHTGQWARVGQPLRPGPVDIGIAEAMARQAVAGTGQASPRSLVLGVTPELVAMNWPSGNRLISVDRCPGMIGRVLPQAGQARVRGVCGNWLQLPLASDSLDLIAGDGCFTVLETLADHRAFSAELARVLDAGGCLIMRLFVRPDQPETVDQVLGALTEGQIGNFHIFKWRLAMALHQDLDRGVAVADIWRTWQGRGPVAEALSAQGWPLAEIETIRAYENATARYTFPRLDEARDVLSRDFVELACQVPDYELGERCPTLLLRVRH